MTALRRRTAVMALLAHVWVGSQVAAQQSPAPQLVITGATPDPDGQTLTITGASFGSRPFVTLDLVPVTVRYAADWQIVSAVPVDAMPPGTYLLTVSRGPSPTENGSFQLTLGAAASASPEISTRASAPSPLTSSGEEPAAKVADRVITLAEVDEEWRRTDPGGYAELSRKLYDARRRIADRMIGDEVIAREAASRGLTAKALLDEEIPKRIVTMPDSAVLALYQSLGERTRGATLEQMRPALRAWLERITQPELAKMNYVEELMKISTRAEVFLVPPRIEVERTAQDAVIGPDTAPVEIVTFGDFESAEYARFALVFSRIRETYGQRVRLVFKHLPVLGPESMQIAEAAACANAQGRFWPYHDAVLGRPGPFPSDRLKQIATEVGLDRRAFDACLDGRTYSSVIRQALQEAERYAITSTPSFLVNGALAPPPPPFLPPFEFFTRVIEEELQRQARAASKAR